MDDGMRARRDDDRHLTSAFYDDLAADYHLLFADWSAASAAQAAVIGALISAELGGKRRDVLDCACGIGTQAIGPAALGHRVVAGDLSPAAARRASTEAAARRLALPTVAADMADLPFRANAFDVVICADNAIAHLLDPVALGQALHEMRRVLRADGLLVIGTRSDLLRQNHPTTSPPQVHQAPEGPVITFQMLDWHPDGQHYGLRHIQLKPDGDSYSLQVRHATSWAITRGELTHMVEAAGYRVAWHTPDQTGFGQHLLTGRPRSRTSED